MLRCVKLVLNALIIAYCFIVETFIDKPAGHSGQLNSCLYCRKSSFQVNPLIPNIKIQILFFCSHARSCCLNVKSIYAG